MVTLPKTHSKFDRLITVIIGSNLSEGTIFSPTWRRVSEYVTLDQTFYNFLFKQELLAAPI